MSPAPRATRVLRVEDLPDGRRISIVEALDGSWMRITVLPDFLDDERADPGPGVIQPEGMHIERGIYNAETGSFVEWTDVREDRQARSQS